eukprot:CAMPEP_0170450314 /NCGR_PEP_ID=MMETSP0117_2-20130122/51705_1 /TAXON_ID=400756 /ORGANISM="Durinskia baltica, Strain CSIRO CS-38" /LENGTH=756 /DNA_ID=CAMNT_0010711601 /DNA_START=817 /DNA_END=3087 /DNA_ORIENTATION=+
MWEMELTNPSESAGKPKKMSELMNQLREAGDLSLMRQQYVRSMHALGILEGVLSCNEINQWYENFYDGLFSGGEVNIPTMEFLEQNHVWMNTQASLYWEVDEYWMVIKGVMSQLEGLLIGAQKGCPGVPIEENNDDDAHNINDYKGVYMPSMMHGVAMQHLLLMNANGDMFQIMQKFPENVANTTNDGRHGDNTVDTDPVIDDYVDDYSIQKSHNLTAVTDDDDESYAYSYRARRLSSDDNKNEHNPFYHPRPILPSAIPKGVEGTKPKPLSADLTAEQILALPNIGADHCSAIIKLLPDMSDVVFGHDTWDSYQTAYPRVFKHFKYNRMKDSVPIRKDMIDVYFSASPGLLASIDDFYVIHGKVANLAVTETSLDIYNMNLVDLINPSTMLCWARAIAANRLATSGNTWVEAFSRYHSGTYANQWMVLDFNRFVPYQKPRSGFLMVLGVSAKCELDITYCHVSTPRAKIFRSKQAAVQTVSDVQTLLQYNQYATDRDSKRDSCRAIACRKDLEPAAAHRSPFGAIDAKVSSVSLASRKYASEVYSSLRSAPDATSITTTTPTSTSLRTVDTTASTATSTSSESDVRLQPVILVKLGPTVDGNEPFCWAVVGETEGDVTTEFAEGMHLPRAVERLNIPIPLEIYGNNTRRNLRTHSVTTGSEDGEKEEDKNNRVGEGVNDNGDGERKIKSGSSESVESESGSEEGKSAAESSVDKVGPIPTAQPTFLQGPRKYVHAGHPKCFNFGWETMPPPVPSA